MSSSVEDTTNTTDNIMDNRDDSEATNEVEELPIVRKIDNPAVGVYGYQCARVVENNIVNELPVSFFIDLAFPKESQQLALLYLQEQLIEAVAFEYGVNTGTRCDDPLIDGSTWLVQILSRTSDWKHETIFDSCRELQYDEKTQDCFVFQAVVRGSVLSGDMSDVLEFMEREISGKELTKASPYSVGFLGVPVMAEDTGDSGRNNLNDASNVNQLTESEQTLTLGRETITIVGGLLVAGFCAAFIGIGLVLWRRRRQWIHGDSRDDEYPHGFDLDKAPHCFTQPHYSSDEDEHEGNVPTGITYREEQDMGYSFNHQVMGVHRPHGSSHRSQADRSLSSSIGSAAGFEMGLSGHPHPYNNFHHRLGNDAASDASDADSWAQTDGTIGSLDLQLEPITAEV